MLVADSKVVKRRRPSWAMLCIRFKMRSTQSRRGLDARRQRDQATRQRWHAKDDDAGASEEDEELVDELVGNIVVGVGAEEPGSEAISPRIGQRVDQSRCDALIDRIPGLSSARMMDVLGWDSTLCHVDDEERQHVRQDERLR